MSKKTLSVINAYNAIYSDTGKNSSIYMVKRRLEALSVVINKKGLHNLMGYIGDKK